MIILLRGLPGSGKSTLGKQFGTCVSADDYFMVNGEYKFDPSRIKDAHEWCQKRTVGLLDISDVVCVANTFTQEWEMAPYFLIAKERGIKISTLVVENRHGGENIHGVPPDVIEKMRRRFEIVL